MELLGQIMDSKNTLVRLGKDSYNLLEAFLSAIRGTPMFKYTFKHGKKENREFSISTDLQSFQWKPANSNRNIRKHSISDIAGITPGNSEFDCKNHHEIKQDPENFCFTIHLKDRPVNVVAINQKQRDMWLACLNYLTKADKISAVDEIMIVDTQFNEAHSRIVREFQSCEKDVMKSTDSFMLVDPEVTKMKKKMKELEKNNSRLQKELFEINSKADKEFIVGDELKKEIKTKEKTEKKLQGQIEMLRLNYENNERDFTQKILNFEEKLSQKDSKLLEVQSEYDEFKKQIKESFNRTLVQKVQQYRESKEVLCSYVNFLKERLETIEKEVALWQAVVHTHVLPIYQSKKAGKTPQFKQVLEFALDMMERKFLTDRSQSQFMSLLAEARKNAKS